MKLTLPEALHARPANLLVRLAAQHAAVVELRRCGARADARRILEVLALGAAKGDEIEIVATGEGAEAAIVAIAELVTRAFDADLVPETGSAAVEGIAIGRAVVVTKREADARARGTREEEVARLRDAELAARASLDRLMDALGEDERSLFAPERTILGEMTAAAIERVRAGEEIEEALSAMVADAASDLLTDARARLLDALCGEPEDVDAMKRVAALEREEVVLVAEALTPSLVASLPAHVRGIVAAEDEPDARRAGVTRTSHAAILARGRALPLAFVPTHVALAISEGDVMVVDTTVAPARVWVAPSEALIVDARSRRETLVRSRDVVARDAAEVTRALGVELYVNVGSLHDRVPAEAAGVGLVRTELVFADRASAPSEADQLAALLAIARSARGKPITVRLFDAGGDKPLAWLPASRAEARGIALLFEHEAVLAAQCAALARAAQRSPVRVLIPLVRSPADVEQVRARLPGVPVGAMIETREAALDARAIASASDFVSIGTNDLAASVLGPTTDANSPSAALARGDATRALDRSVLTHVAGVASAARALDRRVTVCGEVAADARGARILVGLGVDGLSVSPPRFSDAVFALRGRSRDECVEAARAARGA